LWTPAQPLFPVTIGPVTEAALFHGLPGARPIPDDPALWRAEMAAISSHGLAGLALAAAREAGVSLPDVVRGGLRAVQVAQVGATLAVEAQGSAAVSRLARSGVPSVVTKGPGVAAAYPVSSHRVFGDIDLLIRQQDFDASVAILRQSGLCDAPRVRSRKYFDRYCYEGLNFGGEGAASIDLHHHIPPWRWGERLRFEDLCAASRRTELAGSAVQIADPIHNLLICALHVVADREAPGCTLKTWRDVVALSAASEPSAIVAEARRTHLDWWLRFILSALPLYAQSPSLLEGLAAAEPTPGDRLRLRWLLPPSIGARHHIGQMFRLPIANAAAFALGEAFPSFSVIQTKLGPGTSTLSWWRASQRRLRHGDRHWPAHEQSEDPGQAP
jgi:hypothetical protein